MNMLFLVQIRNYFRIQAANLEILDFHFFPHTEVWAKKITSAQTSVWGKK